MKYITLSDIAYKEFKDFLDENNATSYNVRINISDYTCHGPIFAILFSEASENDISETINEITFIIEKNLIDEFGGFIIVSDEENKGNGLGLKPVILPTSGCSGCQGGCQGGCQNGCQGGCKH